MSNNKGRCILTGEEQSTLYNSVISQHSTSIPPELFNFDTFEETFKRVVPLPTYRPTLNTAQLDALQLLEYGQVDQDEFTRRIQSNMSRELEEFHFRNKEFFSSK